MSMPAEEMSFDLEEQRTDPDPMSEDEVLSAVDHEIRQSKDEYDAGTESNRVNAWNFFRGTSPGAIDPDVSECFQSVVSNDVADVIEATLAEIMPAFMSDRPAEFDQMGPNDEDQAALESDVVNDILMESGTGSLELTTAAKDALLLRKGIIEISWDDSKDVSYTTAEGVPVEQLAAIEAEGNVEIREIERSQQQAPPQIAPSPVGAIVVPGPELLDVELRILTPRDRVKVEAVPVDEMLVSSDTTSLDYDTARFVARQTLVSRSSLIAGGFDRDLVEELPAYVQTSADVTRAVRERNYLTSNQSAGDRGMDQIIITRCYYRLDEDRDGIAELREIIVAGDRGSLVMLSDETTDVQPFAIGAGYIWQHQSEGISLYDKLKTVQILKTKFWRIMLEAGQRAARDRVGLLPGTNKNEFMKSQFGGAVSMTNAQGMVGLPNQQFPAQLGMLGEMADKARREGGGGAVDKAGQENMPVEAGAHGVERLMTAIEELNSMVARMLSETIVRQSYLKIHHMLRKYGTPIERKVGGEWQQINPREWRPRTKVGISTGLTMNDRARMSAAFGGIASRQMELMDKGSTLVDQHALYRALVNQARMAGINNPGSYFIDPTSPEGQQAAQQAQQSQQMQQQQAQQAQAAQLQAQGQMLAQIEQVKGQVDLEKTRMQEEGDMAKLFADQKKAADELELKYDGLRLQLAEMEQKYSADIEDPTPGG